MRLFSLILSVITVFCSCNGGTENSVLPPAVYDHSKATSSLNDTGTQQLLSLIDKYYSLKDALVASDAGQTDKAAEQLRIATVQLEKVVNSDSLNTIKLEADTDSLLSGINGILAVKDETTEFKRIPFEKVSDAVYRIIIASGLENAGIYRQYCPMAFNDKGAYWLSYETAIRNPYFGTKMLECGEITDTL